jgi:hypothetical protein
MKTEQIKRDDVISWKAYKYCGDQKQYVMQCKDGTERIAEGASLKDALLKTEIVSKP